VRSATSTSIEGKNNSTHSNKDENGYFKSIHCNDCKTHNDSTIDGKKNITADPNIGNNTSTLNTDITQPCHHKKQRHQRRQGKR
jgi:hypothetical protein